MGVGDEIHDHLVKLCGSAQRTGRSAASWSLTSTSSTFRVLGMEIPVADDAPALAHRPMVGEPGHGLLQTAEAPARDPALEAGGVAVQGPELPAAPRPARPARRLALPR